ncbi:MAG: GNAT family N-acetyltransferase [Spirochaetales bacterium]|nr:GNAT family N-acetyltransferase [Spirochaetales bacterium]
MNIKKAIMGDADDIRALFCNVYKAGHPYLFKDTIQRDIENVDITSLLLYHNGKAVGFGQVRKPEYPFLSYEDSACEISRLCVHKAFQHQGISKIILAEISSIIRAKNPSFVTADCTTEIDYSQRALRNFNLKPVGLFRGLAPDFTGEGQSTTVLMLMNISKDFAASLTGAETVFLPPSHEPLAKMIYESFGLKRVIDTDGGHGGDRSGIKADVDKHLYYAEKMRASAGFNYGFVVIDLSGSDAPDSIGIASEAGCMVEGLIPLVKNGNGSRSDKLIMRKIPDAIDTVKIRIAPVYAAFREMIFGRGR